MPLVSPPKMRAEYRAAIRAMLEEIHGLFDEMDQNQAEMERKRAEFEIIGARTDANLRALQEQLESLRRSGRTDAQRSD
jgi:predicted  nucleic acid-binding Zn-ribbon protein